MQDPEPPPGWTARLVLRAARHGVLATQSAGQPTTGLVTPATTAESNLLLLLSDLSEHTRQLRADPRCAVMVVGEPTQPNPQTAPRVSIHGKAQISDAPELKARFLDVHPYAALYADFADFHLWLIRPDSAAFVGGFARAFRLSSEQLLPDPVARERIAAAATEIAAHCNTDHADTLALLAGASTPARMVGVDTDGCDLAVAESTRRVAWSRLAATPDDIRRELILLARAARARQDAAPAP